MQHLDTIVVIEGGDHGRRAGRTADDGALEGGEAQTGRLHVAQHHLPDRRHAGRIGDVFGFDQLVDRFAIQARTRKDELGACQGRRIRDAPGVDVEHGHDRQDRVTCTQAHHIGQRRRIRVQNGRTVAVQGCLGVARRTAGVAHAGCRVLVERGPCIGLGLRGDPAFVALQVGNAGIGRQLVGVAQGDEMAHRGAFVMNRLDDGQEGHVKAQDLIFRVVGDPGDLLGVQARVDGVQHAA